jgi:hypothetical protein
MNEIEIVIEDKTYKIRAFETGEIQRETKSGAWKPVKNTANHNRGYNVILIGKKQYMRSRLMFLAFMKHESMPEKILMHHKDGDRLNCALSNLTVETYSSISYYRTDPSGYQYDVSTKTYNATITKDGELIQLGKFDTEDEAYDAYIKARTTIQQAQRSWDTEHI